MQVVFGIFKVAPAINSIKSTLTPDEKMEALEYRRFDNYIMLNCPKTINGVRSFLPVKGKDNIDELRDQLFVHKSCKNDLEYFTKLLELREKVMSDDQRDPFLPTNHNFPHQGIAESLH